MTTKTTTTAANVLNADEAEHAIERLCQYIQFPTVSSLAIESGAYKQCADWLLQQLLHNNNNNNNNDTTTTTITTRTSTSTGSTTKDSCFDEVFVLPESPSNAPVIVAKICGNDPTKPILLLNSHYDVVPATFIKKSEVVDKNVEKNNDDNDNNNNNNTNTTTATTTWNLGGWTVPPFDGIRRDGKIYGRGTQDMKSVGIQYIEAIRKIYTNNPQWKPVRDIYLTFVPDEEVGGAGMAAFLDSTLYKDCIPGIALALDEGLASENSNYCIFYGERLPWWVDITSIGPTGHASRFINNTAVEQIIAIANKALEYREGQRSQLGLTHTKNCSHAVAAAAAATANNKKNTLNPLDTTTSTIGSGSGTSASAGTSTTTPTNINTLGDVTSLNITTLEAGVRVGSTYAYNCVPPLAKCTMDIRISPHTPPSEIASMLDQWCLECSSSSTGSKDGSAASASATKRTSVPTISWSFVGSNDGKMKSNDLQEHSITSVDTKINPWYNIFVSTIEDSINKQGIVEPQVFPAATDSRFLRALGIRAFGFSPMRDTPIMLHEDDEYIPEVTFIEGIGVYYYLIQALGSFNEE